MEKWKSIASTSVLGVKTLLFCFLFVSFQHISDIFSISKCLMVPVFAMKPGVFDSKLNLHISTGSILNEWTGRPNRMTSWNLRSGHFRLLWWFAMPNNEDWRCEVFLPKAVIWNVPIKSRKTEKTKLFQSLTGNLFRVDSPVHSLETSKLLTAL